MLHDSSRTVTCPACSGRLTLSDENLQQLAGKKLECPNCGKLLRLPEGWQAPELVTAEVVADKPSLELRSRQKQQNRSFLGLAISVLLGGLTAIAVYFLLFDPFEAPVRKRDQRKPADARVADRKPKRLRQDSFEQIIDPSMFPDDVALPKPEQQAVKPDKPAKPDPPKSDGQEKPSEKEPAVAPKPEPGEREKPETSPPETDVAIAKLPVPDVASQREQTEFIRDLFRDEYAGAKDAKSRRALAEKLIAVAAETHDNHVARFVLLREARDAAALVGGIEVSFKAVDSLCGKYAGINPFRTKAEVLAKAVGTAKDEAANTSIGERALKLLSEAVMTDSYGNIEQLKSLIFATARKTKNAAFLARARSRIADVRECEQLFQKAQAARDSLEENEDDPDANLAVGTYLCFAKNDWANGLPMLVRGNEPPLQSLAKNDLAKPSSPEAQLRLADAWWDFAESAEGLVSTQARLRASVWYQHALPKLSGLQKVKASKRIGETKSLR